MLLILRDELQNQTKSKFEYILIISDLLPFLTNHEKVENSGLIDYWVELCAREAENDGKHSNEERLAALAVLSDIWLTFTEFVDQREEMTNTILFMLKRAVRERTKSIRTASTIFLFRMLETLSATKNKSAPVILKTLIFALIENPNDPTIRSMYL
jgi:hypothetical protein